MKVKVINKSKHQLPEYATIASAGLDLRANISEPITLNPLERRRDYSSNFLKDTKHK